MGAKVGTDGAFDDMNLTPLIDVVLVVLIIMMVSIPIQVQEMGVKLPCLDCPPPPVNPDNPPEQLVISVYEDGTVALNRRLMKADKISFELNRRLRPMTQKNVFIDAHKSTKYAAIVSMIDLARGEGAEKVGLAKMKEGGPLPYTSVDAGTIPKGIHIGSPLVVGMITEKKADLALQPLKGAIQSCYYKELGANPDVTGRMMLTVKLNPDGSLYEDPTVSGSTIEGATAAMEPCVLDALKSLRSEALGEGNTAAVTYPVIFSPG